MVIASYVVFDASADLAPRRLEAARLPVGSLPTYGKWQDGSACGFASGMDTAWITPDRAHALLALRFSVGGDACVGGADIDGLAVVDLPSTAAP